MLIIKKYKYFITVVIIVLLFFTVIIIKNNLNKGKYENIEFDDLTEDENGDYSSVIDISLDNCTVDIKGAINNPGVYDVECSKNVNDVIEIAGGLTDEADTSVINLAKKVSNEMVIVIYTKSEVKNSNIVDTVVKIVEKECVCPNIKNDGCLNTEINQTIGNNDNSLININTASLELLQTLPGIGEAKARAIIKYREENGIFKEIEDILNVEGIGQKMYDEIKIYITT